MKRKGSVGPARSYRGADSSPRGRSTNITHLFIRRLDPPSRRRFPSEENPQGEFLPTARPSGDDACGRNVPQCRASSLGRRENFAGSCGRSGASLLIPVHTAWPSGIVRTCEQGNFHLETTRRATNAALASPEIFPVIVFRRQLIYLLASFRNALQYLVP